MFEDAIYGECLKLDDLKKELGVKISFPVHIDKNKKFIILFIGYDNVSYGYQKRSNYLFPRDLIYQYKTNNEEIVREFYDLVKSDDIKVIFIEHHGEDKFTFIGEVNTYDVDLSTKVINKIYLEFYIKDEYASMLNTWSFILNNNINDVYCKNSTIKESSIQNIILNIIEKYIVLSTGIEKEKRNFYLKNYIRKSLYYGMKSKATGQWETKEILLPRMGLESGYGINTLDDKSETYNKFIKDITHLDVGLGIGIKKSYMVLTYLYLHFDTYKKMESRYINFLKGGYNENDFSIFMKKLKSHINNLENLGIKSRYNIHSYELEYEVLERVSLMHRIGLISSILKEKNLEPSEYLIKDMICILNVSDVDYSMYLINRYFSDKDRFNKLDCVTEAILYKELIMFSVDTITRIFMSNGYKVEYNNNSYNINFDYESTINIDSELNKIIFENMREIRVRRSMCENKEEDKSDISTRLFYSNRLEYDYILNKIYTCIYGDVFRI